ncbi:MAG: hypothetical protein MR368_03365 [Azospirillum sp.]|nr:hypothetical protein [Azospirillum sp.]
MEDYFIDYPHLLKINLDYSKEISLEIVEDKGSIVPIMKYLGTDKQSGNNVISNLEKIISIMPENGGYNLYLKDECFAHFKEDETTHKIVLDTKHPQKHLTAFEMRLLARKNIEPQVFSRDDINGLKHSTDLHTHFAGCLSPEELIEVGIKHDLSIPSDILSKIDIDISKYNSRNIKLTDLTDGDLQKYASSMRIPLEQQETFNKMEEIYVMRGPFTKNKELFPDLLRKVAESHTAVGIKYAEFSLSSVIGDMDILKTIHKELPQIEQETGCKIRFLAAMWRHSDKEWNQDEVDRIKSVAQSPYIVGIDFMGHETNSTMEFGEELKEIAKWAALNDPSFVMRVHAGENPLFQDNVKDVLKIVKEATQEAENESGSPLKCPAIRIGHGLYGVDEECLQLCKETGAIIEFNMASNLSLNNIDNIKDVPLKKYIDNDIKFVLGSDGMGIYSTNPEQDVILAHAAGVSKEDFVKMNDLEQQLISSKNKRFGEKETTFHKLLDTGKSFEEIFKPKYSTENGETHYNDSVWQRKNAEIKKLQEFLNSEISRIGAETDFDKVAKVMTDKMPILVTGASVKAWPNISKEQQDEIRTTMQVLVNVIDPNKAYIMTGGTNHGVEKQLHEVAHCRNLKKEPQLAIIGTLTEEAAYQDKASIEENTITHAVVLSLNGKIAKRWFDLPDTVLNVVAENKGEMIAIGGGGIVRDMIQRAHNMNLGINLMNGPEGASTEKATIMQEYAFEGAKGLIKKLYKRHPDIFVENFDIKHLNQYVEKAKNEQQMAVHINELKSQVSQKNIDQKVKKTYIKPQMFIKDMNNLTL